MPGPGASSGDGRASSVRPQTSELELERGAALFVGLREGALGVGIEVVVFQTAEGMQAFGGQLCLQGMRVQMLSGRECLDAVRMGACKAPRQHRGHRVPPVLARQP